MKTRQQGFTLVELAIVLVIIGLILGMAFKGKDLIDGAKVKNIQAQYNKVLAASNTYFEKYGSYPGDGCTAAPAANATTCPIANTRNGTLDTAIEANAFWTLLINSNILSAAEQQSVFGQPWTITTNTVGAVGPVSATGVIGNSYMTLGTPLVPAATADRRFVCAVDRLMDDGIANTGIIRSSGGYTAATQDCWALTGNATILMRILP